MQIYVVTFLGGNGSSDYQTMPIHAGSRNDAIVTFQKNYSNRIVRADNKTVHDNVSAVAKHLISFAKLSDNRDMKNIGKFSKPISEVSITIFEEFMHLVDHIENDHHFDAKLSAKKIYESVIVGFSR
ncbi:hypothetical protein [Dyadobacter frigoris]|uniref:Uncharacterized protein n=1 Tax=Dyadobacter frigoris TaxID=2576211 RepID=A0A4U6DAU1_9BACT|nr:hypothetical protein [Dyadobacter frigoris]TKT93318.1 hypothetical protein FDK13_05555 [Dyadobacter frigoris]